MKNKLIYVVGIGVIVSLLILNSIRLKSSDEPQGAYASWLSEYLDYPTLVRESEAIIVGTVIESIPFEQDGLVYTAQQITVQEVLSGSLRVGDSIRLIQTGGELEKQHLKTMPFLEDPLLIQKHTYLLFLERSWFEPDKWWWLMGGYQGRAEIFDDGRLHCIAHRNDIVAQEFQGRTLTEIKNDISQIQ